MRKGIMALEDNEEVVEDGELDLDVAKGETISSEIDNESDQIAESESIADSVDDLTEQVEAKVEDGEGISEETAKAVDVAVEHFKLRLGYTKRVIPAMEGFANSKTRLDKTKAALENLKELQLGIHTKLNVAQEGFIDKIKDAIEFAFDTEVKVIGKVKEASTMYDASTPSNREIVNPIWGRHLFGGTGHTYTGKNAINALQVIERLLDDTKLKTDIGELGKCLVKLTKEVRGIWFVSNEHDIERIEKIHAEITGIRDEVIKLVDTTKQMTSTTFTPLDKADKTKIVALATKVLTDKTLEKEIASFMGKSGALALWSVWNSQIRLKGLIPSMALSATGISGLANLAISGALGMSAEDLNAARKANNEARDVVNAIKDILNTRIKFCTGIAKYIQASAS